MKVEVIKFLRNYVGFLPGEFLHFVSVDVPQMYDDVVELRRKKNPRKLDFAL